MSAGVFGEKYVKSKIPLLELARYEVQPYFVAICLITHFFIFITMFKSYMKLVLLFTSAPLERK